MVPPTSLMPVAFQVLLPLPKLPLRVRLLPMRLPGLEPEALWRDTIGVPAFA